MGKKKLTNIYIKTPGHIRKHGKSKKKGTSLTWILIIFAILVLAGYFLILNPFQDNQNQNNQNNSNTYEELYFDDASPVMYFYSDGCGACRLQKQLLEEIADEGYRVKPMDVGEHPEYWGQYNVRGTPTFIAENGEMLVGYTQKDELKQFLDEHDARIAI